MGDFQFIPQAEFNRVHNSKLAQRERLTLLSEMNRANTLVLVKRAGSGHLGSSFSSLDIVTLLYYDLLNIRSLGVEHPERDIYYSSKGHDAPAQYAVLHSLGILSAEQVLNLRRLDGVHGHPERITPGMEANTGSLGMGISKGKGIALAKKLSKQSGRIIVMTGDGELQEGQNYEAFATAIHHGVTNLLVIVDHNKIQTDKLVSEICNLGELERKVEAFGWYVGRCNGHDFDDLERAIAAAWKVTNRPKFLIADTIKGRGVSFMEHPGALTEGEGIYRWHSGAPDDQSFAVAHKEILARIEQLLATHKLSPLTLELVPPHPAPPPAQTKQFVAEGFEEELLELGTKHRELVVLDADLADDCRVRKFERSFPERFFEIGISEQDMVSTAGGLALQGFLPVVNSFAAFLSARANEQIYANACERTKIIYACHYAGLTPAGPGSSHQSVRDISLFAALPEVLIAQPVNPVEARAILRYFVELAPTRPCMMRLQIGPSPSPITLDANYQLRPGRGNCLREGRDAALLAYGPVMVHEALLAAELAKREGISLAVWNMPWLNTVEVDWLLPLVTSVRGFYVLEDHSSRGGLGEFLFRTLAGQSWPGDTKFGIFGADGYLACGAREEVLRHHRLDAASLVKRIATDLGRSSSR